MNIDMNDFIKNEYKKLLCLTRDVYSECNFDEATLNKSKNRYNDVLATEKTRVKLSTEPDKSCSDYINANLISDKYLGLDQKYICSQAPLPSTFNDFWKMIWEQDVGSIVTLIKLKENGKIKGERYWPNKVGNCNTYGNIQVELYKMESEKYLTLNLFNLHYNNETRRVIQFYFRGWPDFGVPQSTFPIRQLCQMLKEYHKPEKNQNQKILVHCSAGIGRTGTFLAILMALDRREGSSLLTSSMESSGSTTENDDDNDSSTQSGSFGNEFMYEDRSSLFNSDNNFEMFEKMNINDIVLSLRKQRNPGMVQTEDQYKFIYQSIYDDVVEKPPYIPDHMMVILSIGSLQKN